MNQPEFDQNLPGADSGAVSKFQAGADCGVPCRGTGLEPEWLSAAQMDRLNVEFETALAELEWIHRAFMTVNSQVGPLRKGRTG